MARAGVRDVPRGAPLVVVTRGGRAESFHRGSIAVVSAEGRLLAAAGDPFQPIWLRSSAKPFQLIPFLAAGGAERFSLTTSEIALAAASHSGEEVHARLAARMLAKGGFTERDLHCGAHPPFHEPSARALVRAGKMPGALHNNCSGKHAAMLLACRLFSLPSRGYWKPAHPLQRRILAVIARMTGVAARDVGIAVDGCSVPVFHVPLAGLAGGYARLLARTVAGESPAEGAARRRIAAAMTEAPGMVAGTGRFTTFLMGVCWLVAKEGAEGVYAVAARRTRGGPVGIALKIEDGCERGRDAVVVEALRQTGLARGVRLARLVRFADRPVRNVRGDVVGDVRTVFRLEKPGAGA
jgi:L-asparaginase II